MPEVSFQTFTLILMGQNMDLKSNVWKNILFPDLQWKICSFERRQGSRSAI